MEFVWRPFFKSLGTSTQIFTHVLYNHYSPPTGLCFDVRCNDDPFVDDPNLETFNADKISDNLYEWILH